SDFASWMRAILAPTPDPALLQPWIDAGIIDANADTETQQTAINALLAVPTTDDSQPGALLLLAVLQLFYAIFVRVTSAYERFLDMHSRMLALQRQHLDMMSTSVSALAGGIPSDGSGLSFTRIIPFFKLDPTPPVASPPTTPARAATVSTASPAPAARVMMA